MARDLRRTFVIMRWRVRSSHPDPITKGLLGLLARSRAQGRGGECRWRVGADADLGEPNRSGAVHSRAKYRPRAACEVIRARPLMPDNAIAWHCRPSGSRCPGTRSSGNRRTAHPAILQSWGAQIRTSSSRWCRLPVANHVMPPANWWPGSSPTTDHVTSRCVWSTPRPMSKRSSAPGSSPIPP